MWRIAAVALLIVLLAACGVPVIETPQPTASPIPTPGIMQPRQYLPVLLHRYPGTARGVAGGLWGVLDAPYYHHWTISPLVCDPDFVRTIWCLDDYHLTLYKPEIIYAAKHCPGSTWTFMNEPDDRSGRLPGQCGVYSLTGNPLDPANPAPTIFEAPVATAIRFSQTYDLLKTHDPTARVFVGGLGWIGFPETRDWWTRFVGELQRRGELWKIEGVHIHAYPWGSFPQAGMPALFAGLREWHRDYHVGMGLGDRPIWITETGGGSCAEWARWDGAAYTTIRDRTMLPLLRWLDSSQNPGYSAAFWFVSFDGLEASWWCNYLVDARKTPVTLTPLGETWVTR